jgi:hypothetical protein
MRGNFSQSIGLTHTQGITVGSRLDTDAVTRLCHNQTLYRLCTTVHTRYQLWYDTFTIVFLLEFKALIRIVSQELCRMREAEEFSHMIIGPVVIDNK